MLSQVDFPIHDWDFLNIQIPSLIFSIHDSLSYNLIAITSYIRSHYFLSPQKTRIFDFDLLFRIIIAELNIIFKYQSMTIDFNIYLIQEFYVFDIPF